MFKKLCMIGFGCTLAGAAIAQAHPQVHKALASPSRAENEAKADMYVHPKQQVTDSLPLAPKDKADNVSKRKRCCKRMDSK